MGGLLRTWGGLDGLQTGIDASIEAAAFVSLTLRVRSAAQHLAGALRKGLWRRGAAVILLVVGVMGVQGVLIILRMRKRKIIVTFGISHMSALQQP